jgi:hypothetical protein
VAPLPFDTCWERVARAEFHRQSLIQIWNDLDTDKIYASKAKIDHDGNGKFLIRTVQRDWLLPFSLQFGEMLYQLRSALDSCVYDAAVLKFKQNPPPDKEKWEFVFGADSAKFEEAMRRMKKIIPQEIRDLIEAVQPYRGVTGRHENKVWDIGATLVVLNDWARMDRHRKLHLIGTAVVEGNLRIILPAGKGMSLEYCNFTTDNRILEHEHEFASFKIRNFVPDAEVHMNPQFSFDITVDETPRVRLQDISIAMSLSVQIVREQFEQHFGIKR